MTTNLIGLCDLPPKGFAESGQLTHLLPLTQYPLEKAMTQREAFEAWAKSQSLDTDHKEKDAWGREQYSPHIRSMWQGWQAAQAQAAAPAFTTGHCKNKAQPGGCQLHNLQCGYPECDREAAAPVQDVYAAPGDIRALKYRIHELEGEVIGYKQILAEQDAAEPVANIHIWMKEGYRHAELIDWVFPGMSAVPIGEHLLYTTPQPTHGAREAMQAALEALKKERGLYRTYGDEDGAPEYVTDAIAALEKEIGDV